MTRYTVNLEQLSEFADRLEAFNKRADEIELAIDQQIAALHDSWLGEGADGHMDYHARWMEAAKKMRDSLAELRENAAKAHRNYTGVAELNTAMWP
ncbi:MAG: WXG100 family type VII secretion target [Mycobacterium sp.]